jgi:DNA transformation protein and related proteins
VADDSFYVFVKELFARLGPVQIKRMFGGAGGYADSVMFLLIADDTIHIKTDDALKAELREVGSGPFEWTPKNGPRAGERIDLGYWRLPESALDDPDEAVVWGRKALAVARAKAKTKLVKKAGPMQPSKPAGKAKQPGKTNKPGKAKKAKTAKA